MNLRIARKILIRGRQSDRDRPNLPSRYECQARRKVIQHWRRWCYPDGYCNDDRVRSAPRRHTRVARFRRALEACMV